MSNPKNEKLSTTSMMFSSIVSSGIATVLCGYRNTIHFDLFTFKDNLFNFNIMIVFLIHHLLYFYHTHLNQQLVLYPYRDMAMVHRLNYFIYKF